MLANIISSLYEFLISGTPENSRPLFIKRTSQFNEASTYISNWYSAKESSGFDTKKFGAWNLSYEDFYSQMTSYNSAGGLIGTYSLNQGYLNCCPYVSLLFAISWAYPLAFVKFAIELFETGSGKLGSNLTVTPNQGLRSKTPEAISEFMKSKKDYPYFLHWILLVSIIDHVNGGNYGGTDGTIDQGKSGAWKAAPVNFLAFLDDLTPDFFSGSVNNGGASVYTGFDNTTDFKTISQQHNAIFIRASSSIFGGSSFAEHFVTLLSPINFDVDNGTQKVSFYYQSYGKRVFGDFNRDAFSQATIYVLPLA